MNINLVNNAVRLRITQDNRIAKSLERSVTLKDKWDKYEAALKQMIMAMTAEEFSEYAKRIK